VIVKKSICTVSLPPQIPAKTGFSDTMRHDSPGFSAFCASTGIGFSSFMHPPEHAFPLFVHPPEHAFPVSDLTWLRLHVLRIL